MQTEWWSKRASINFKHNPRLSNRVSVILTSRILKNYSINFKECKQNALSREQLNPGLVLNCFVVTGDPLSFYSPKFLLFFGSSKWKNKLRIQGLELYSFLELLQMTTDWQLKTTESVFSQIPETESNKAVWRTVPPSQALGEDPFLTSSSF